MVVPSKPQPGFSAFAVVLISGVIAFAVPPQRRTVVKVSRPDEPVAIVAIKAKGKAIESGKPFPGKNDWPGGLSFVVKNNSTRLVSWVRVAMTFRREKNGVRLNDFVTYGIGHWDVEKLRGGGPPLKPGETAEASYSMEQYQSIREILDGMNYPKSIPQIEVSVEQLIFTDQPDLMWIEGTMNEFQSPNGWKPVKP